MKLYNKWNLCLTSLEDIHEEGYAQKIIEDVMAQKSKVTLMKRNMDNEKSMSIFHSLTTLHRNLRGIEEETGLYDLYVGYPFLSGTFLDGSFFRAPLFLYPVRLDLNKAGNQQWY
jgi:hypothetical protein